MSRDHENRGQYFEEVQQDGAIIRTISECWENARCEMNGCVKILVAVHGFWKMENFQSPKMPKLLILSADLKF